MKKATQGEFTRPRHRSANGAAPAAAPARTVTRTAAARIPTDEGEFHLYHYTNEYDGKEHLALVHGDVAGAEHLPVRVHSECFTGDVLGSRRCDCGDQLHRAMRMIAAEGRGVIVYLRQEGRGIGLSAKLRAYNLQDEGYDTVEANLLLGHEADERDYWAAAAILADLEVRSIRLLTNNPAKIEQLRALGVNVTGRVGVIPAVHDDNRDYLVTKVQRMRHMLELPGRRAVPVSSFSPSLFPAEIVARLAHLRRMMDHPPTGRADRGRPHITLTYAQSLDGSIAAAPGRPLRLSSDAAMRMTHALRATHDAILVGIGTVLADDPRLSVRLVEGDQPQPVILDSRLRLPLDARVLAHPRPPLVASSDPDPARRAALEKRGVEVLALPAAPDGHGVDLPALLAALHARGVRSVMVEGGAQVLSAFLAAGLADAVVVTVAPVYVGGLNGIAPDGTRPALPRLRDVHYTRLQDDVVVWAEPEFGETRD
jgi:3,4-dihydroxy 2-butanone 4-phosphate synthase/GTP cyclohydrolase II